MSEWQPISTAPRDGSRVLVNDTVGNAQWVIARWEKDEAGEFWEYDDYEMSNAYPFGPLPTHWLPIPPVQTE